MHTFHIIVVLAQQSLVDLGLIVVDVLRSYTIRHTTLGRTSLDE